MDHNGVVLNRAEYYPFGDTALTTTSKKRYRYVGKELDSESGLYYYGARYYAAWVCRFISIDKMAHDFPHLNPYNYAGNKPINSLDLDGMQSPDEQKGPSNGAQQNNAAFAVSRKHQSSFTSPSQGTSTGSTIAIRTQYSHSAIRTTT
ncbi:MAG: hypothetical protein IPF78_04330 [Flavobacteriales bacterium]|nr:hypothetical protein [Flavobacteriales bacterium]